MIITSDQAKGREELAHYFAFDTDLAADTVLQGGVAFTSVYGLCGDTFWDGSDRPRGGSRHLPLR